MDEFHFVPTTQDGKETDLWITAGPPEMALVRVLEHLPSGWMATLTGQSLTPKQAVMLGLAPNEARKLRSGELATSTP